MKKRRPVSSLNGGFSSIEFLIVLFFLSAVAVAAMYIAKMYQKSLNRSIMQSEDRQMISAVADAVLADLKADVTPMSDSKQDIFWSWNGIQADGVTVSLRSLSSSLNPNFVRVSLCEKTDINSLFQPGTNAAMLQQYREDSGMLFSYDGFRHFFSEETYEKYFSVYSWANINLSDEFSLRNIVSERTGSESDGELFRQKLRTLLVNNQLIQSNMDFKMFAGVQYDSVFPYVMTEPVMNIHFVEPLLLESIVSYPEYAVSAPKSKASQLISLREVRELSQNDIANILGVTKSDRLYYYFGTVTWFWEIRLEKGRESCVIIVCRYPADDMAASAKPDWNIIERRWK